MKLISSVLAIGLVQGRYYHGNGKCGTLESCSGNLIMSREDGCCNPAMLCKMYSTEDDFKEVFPNIDCDNLPEDIGDKPNGKPDGKPDGRPDNKPDDSKDGDHEKEQESHLNFEPHNSNIQNFINYNTDFETKINFNLGGARENTKIDDTNEHTTDVTDDGTDDATNDTTQPEPC